MSGSSDPTSHTISSYTYDSTTGVLPSSAYSCTTLIFFTGTMLTLSNDKNVLLTIVIPILLSLFVLVLILFVCTVTCCCYRKKSKNHTNTPNRQFAYNMNYVSINGPQVTYDQVNNMPQHIHMQHQPQLEMPLYETIPGGVVSPVASNGIDGQLAACSDIATYSRLNYILPSQKNEDTYQTIDASYQSIQCESGHKECTTATEATYNTLKCN